MLSNLPFKVVPIAFTDAMITTEMPAAIRPYSIAVAPDSFFRNAVILDMCPVPCWLTLRWRYRSEVGTA